MIIIIYVDLLALFVSLLWIDHCYAEKFIIECNLLLVKFYEIFNESKTLYRFLTINI